MGMSEDTIAAIATARGQAALAIVRVSGPEAIQVADRCFSGADLVAADSHTAHVGYLRDAGGEPIDQVVVTLFRAPRSATGEDVAEVSCHGGDLASQQVLARLLEAGARMAEPGEFTKRGFLNGKLDLAQAEAVADLIHASSSRAHRVSMAHLQGRYSELLAGLREELLDLCSFLELELDFSEEDVEFANRARLVELLDEAEKLLDELLGSYRVGRRIRDGVRVVIGGRPNAGKSTLLNALVGRDRAIVSPTPGTTRDEVEAEAEIEGLRFIFVDTAGLRETADAIEAEGVRRAEASIERSDLLLYVYDVTRGLDPDEEELLADLRTEAPELPILLVANKIDLVDAWEVEEADLRLSAERGRREPDAIDALVRRLVDVVAEGLASSEASHVVTNQRHRQHLASALEALRRARTALDSGLSGDLMTLDLREALHELGAITGAVTNEDVLGHIFSRFCIGK